jgi:hypothetical protein
MEYRIVQKEYTIEMREMKVYIPQVKVYILSNRYESRLTEEWEDIGGNTLLTNYISYLSSFPKKIADAEKIIEEHNQKHNGPKMKEDIVVREYSF